MNEDKNNNGNFSLDNFSENSKEYYNKIKKKLESEFKGKYIALDYSSKQYWLGDTATEALSKARDEFPKKLFYLLQVGSSTPFSIQSIKIRKIPNRNYVLTGQY